VTLRYFYLLTDIMIQHPIFVNVYKTYYICNILQVVYMDEPSSGLDPASRKDLWKAVKSAKQERTIILTSTVLHFTSMGVFLD
jgi:ABC-type sugar transport system ATPase subunit